MSLFKPGQLLGWGIGLLLMSATFFLLTMSDLLDGNYSGPSLLLVIPGTLGGFIVGLKLVRAERAAHHDHPDHEPGANARLKR